MCGVNEIGDDIVFTHDRWTIVRPLTAPPSRRSVASFIKSPFFIESPVQPADDSPKRRHWLSMPRGSSTAARARSCSVVPSQSWTITENKNGPTFEYEKCVPGGCAIGAAKTYERESLCARARRSLRNMKPSAWPMVLLRRSMIRTPVHCARAVLPMCCRSRGSSSVSNVIGLPASSALLASNEPSTRPATTLLTDRRSASLSSSRNRWLACSSPLSAAKANIDSFEPSLSRASEKSVRQRAKRSWNSDIVLHFTLLGRLWSVA